MAGNRVVSCGKNGNGSWYARSQVTSISLWNYYASPTFYRNVITGTTGGTVTPDATGLPVASDVFVNAPDLADASNQISGNAFEDPCLAAGEVDTSLDSAEHAAWSIRLIANGKSLGNEPASR